VGKVVQPLQSVSCNDSHAHGHERHGPFTRLVGMVGLGLVKCWVWMVFATGVRPVSSVSYILLCCSEEGEYFNEDFF
jgi:hypothetical protein